MLTAWLRRAVKTTPPHSFYLKKKGFFEPQAGLPPPPPPLSLIKNYGFEGGGNPTVCFHRFGPAISELTVLLQQAAKWKGMQ